MIRVVLTTRLKTYETAGGRKTRRSYVLRWRNSHGQWRQETIGSAQRGCMTRAQAEAVRDAKVRELNDGSALVDKPKKMTVAAFCAYHDELIAGDVRPGTRLHYRGVGDHLTRVLGDVPVERLSSHHVSRFKAYLQEAGADRSAATVRKLLVGAKAMFNRAVAERLLAKNPFAGVRLPRAKQTASHRIFEEAEIAAMLHVVRDDPWWSAFIRLGVATGLRRNEMLHLLWADIDFDQHQVRVDFHRPGTFDVGDRRYPIFAFGPKDHESRVLPLDDVTANRLLRMKAKSGGSRYVFLSLDRLRSLAPRMRNEREPVELVNNLLRRFKAIQREAIGHLAATTGTDPKDIEWPLGSLHDLRRTFGTRCARDGVPMHVLQKLLGHESIETTARFYLGVSASDMERVRQSMGRSAS